MTEKPCSHSSCYTYPTLPVREFHDLNVPVESAIDDDDYAIPDVNFYSTFSPKHTLSSPHLIRTSTMINSNNVKTYSTLKPILPCCIHQQQYLSMYQQSSPILFSLMDETPTVEAPCGNSLMITMNMYIESKQISIKDINSDDVVFIANIGHGLFGSISLAEIKLINNDNKIEKRNVIIKSLNDDVDVKQK